MTKAKAKKRRTKKRQAKKKSGPIVLGSDPGIKSVGELKKQLVAARDAGTTLVVDAGSVESIDIAALQLLAAFARSVRELSRAVEWKELSSVFREMADLADLSECLGIDENGVEEDDDLCPVF